jgi:chemotaxis protein MotB
MATKTTPIIIIKKKGGHGGHHGGAWKVAYADFVTAMMSLFIVLWLMNSSDKVKKAVAGYFNDPKGTASLLGTTMSGNGVSVVENQSDLSKLKEKLEQEIKAKKELEKLSKQIEITITPEGLRIELLEDKNGTFFETGSAQLSGNGQQLLSLLAGELKALPNSLLIEGHTDAMQYSADASYSNWELSADRANSARRLMQQDGVRADQVTQVRGYADQFLRVKSNPYDPSNRRISILVKNSVKNVAPAIHNGQLVGDRTSANTTGIETSEPDAAQEKPLSAANGPQQTVAKIPVQPTKSAGVDEESNRPASCPEEVNCF